MFDRIYRNSRRVRRQVLTAFLLTFPLVGCGESGKAAPPAAPVTMVAGLPDSAVDGLRENFLEVSGSGQVSFLPGSTKLTSKAQFQLERQALWLREHDFAVIRLRSQSTSATGVADRRLAMRRSEAVRDYLTAFGVRPAQFSGVDVEVGRSGTVTTVIDQLHLGDAGSLQTATGAQQ
jgi:hypothetical protein